MITRASPLRVMPIAAQGGTGYEGTTKLNLPAIVLAVGIQAAMLSAFIHMNFGHHHHRGQRLLVVDLALPTAPPPPHPAPKVSPAHRSPIVAPKPIVQTEQPAPAPVTDVEPSPAPAPVIASLVPAPPAPAAPTSSPARPSVIKADDLGARMISGEPPRYPIESRHRREEGRVVLELTLSGTGCVANISVTQSSGFDRLDDAALRAVRKWCWAPVTRAGRSVIVQGEVEIPFVLKS